MKKFAVILFAALALTIAAASAAQAREPLPIVFEPVASSAGTGPDYDHCLIHVCHASDGDKTRPPGYIGPPTVLGHKGLVARDGDPTVPPGYFGPPTTTAHKGLVRSQAAAPLPVPVVSSAAGIPGEYVRCLACRVSDGDPTVPPGYFAPPTT